MNADNIKLLVFDFDGTLLNSFPQLVSSLNLAFKACNLPKVDEQTLRNLFHQGTKHLLKDLVGDDPKLHQEIQKHYFLIYREQMHTSKLYPNVIETLNHLKRQKKLALLTNKQERTTHLLIEQHELNGFFEMVIGGDSLPQRKPSPLPLLHICEHLKISPQATAMIGDSYNDVQAGSAAGCTTIVTLNGNNNYFGTPPNPDLILKKVSDILSLFP